MSQQAHPNPAGQSGSGLATTSSCRFDSARNAFLSSLSPDERLLYAPCASTEELSKSVQKFHVVLKAKNRGTAIIDLLAKLHDAFEPYFKVVNIFVSSNPDPSAIIWGAIQLVLQLASNFVTFFDKLTTLLESLSIAMNQYAEVFSFCLADPGLRQSQVPAILGAIYEDILQIFKQAIRVFTKSDRSVKPTVMIIANLMWKPFNSRFHDQLGRLSAHHNELFIEVSLWHANSSIQEIARNATGRGDFLRYRDLSEAEMECAAKERELAEEERLLAELERRQASGDREQTRALLLKIQQALQDLESDHNHYQRIINWLHAPIFSDVLEHARASRQPNTGMWIFQEPAYKRWLDCALREPELPGGFGANVLWIHGNPGAGKTFLASSILDNLQSQNSLGHSNSRDVYYYFFEHQSNTYRTACSAYRSILAQILSKNRNSPEILDKFSFIMNDVEQNASQRIASEVTLVDLFQMSLKSNSILVLDGIEECEDNEQFLSCLLSAWKFASPYILLLSRVHVARLRRCVPCENQLGLPKSKLSEDIYIYGNNQIRCLFNEGFLPMHAEQQESDMLNRLVSGADGMFLWARLMIHILRSPYMDTSQRLHMFSEINTPEDLESMYSRIVNLILQSPEIAGTIASLVLTRLAYAPAPISSRQLRQSLVVDKVLHPLWDFNAVKEFEETIIMSCAGLVERTQLHEDTSFLYDEPALRVIHLSVTETLIKRHAVSYRGGMTPQAPLVSDNIIGNLGCTTNCLKQLLFHTPAQPLAGRLGQRISAENLYNQLYFSDYAAVNWLLYLRGFVNATIAERRTHGKFSQQFLNVLLDFLEALSVFLRNPKVMSVWIEIFYTTRHVHVMYPPTEPLNGLATWLRHVTVVEPHLSIDPTLISNITGFGAEIRDVVNIWGQFLRDSPHTNHVYQRFSSEVSLPIAISHDVKAFVVLGTLYFVTASINPAEGNYLVMRQLPFSDYGTTRFSSVAPTGNYKRPLTYSITFAVSTEELALLERQVCGHQHVTVCQYDYCQDLNIQVIGTMSLQPELLKIERVLFHPYRAILAFCVFSIIPTRGWNGAILWAYRKDLQQNFPLIGGAFNAVDFSSCGLYLVTRERSQKGLVVVQIAQDLLVSTEHRAPRPAQWNTSFQNTALTTAPLNALRAGSLASGTTGLANLWDVDPTNGNISYLAVNSSGNEISLTSSVNSYSQTVRLVTLPTSHPSSETTQRIFYPRFEGDSLRISVDVDIQNLSTHSSRGLSNAGRNARPAFIQRDPKFILATNPTLHTSQAVRGGKNQPPVHRPRDDNRTQRYREMSASDVEELEARANGGQ
ncbi:hypothetical protein NUW58_g2512 [Xylaria curta]|uniref:Uncharacterized protein n=1 Tax=Xylaria curta TaxID=42375 RepID=A0ACC1PHZ2_9PEZI|nr:hypothetical protein NUW58_g2512 [Xylaria curta]